MSATEEQVVDEVSGIQEVGPGDEDDGGKKLCVTTEEVSPSGAMDSTFQGKNEASGIAGDAANLPEKKHEAWSATEVRAKVLDGTWSAEEARGEARDGTCSTVDCNNGAQVTAADDEGDASADALVQSEVGGAEQEDSGRTEANGAAVADGGVISPLVTMEPKDPAAEESVPAADDRIRDSMEGSLSKEMEKLPTGGLPEVDTVQAVTGKAEPLAKNDDGSVSLERKVDDLAELTGVQDKQLGPMVEAGGVQGAQESVPVSGDKKNEVPNEVTPATHGKHCYEKGDKITGIVRCINVYGAYLEHGDLDVLIPAEGKNTPLFKIGDTVQSEVQRVEEDGTVILDTYLFLEDDGNEDTSSTLRKWKDSSSGTWWQDSWYAGQWDQKLLRWSMELEEGRLAIRRVVCRPVDVF